MIKEHNDEEIERHRQDASVVKRIRKALALTPNHPQKPSDKPIKGLYEESNQARAGYSINFGHLSLHPQHPAWHSTVGID